MPSKTHVEQCLNLYTQPPKKGTQTYFHKLWILEHLKELEFLILMITKKALVGKNTIENVETISLYSNIS